jgi:hypothetical protein
MLGSRSHIRNLTLGCWNINGLSDDKLFDETFCNYVNSVDCCVLVESFITKTDVQISNQYTYCKPATKRAVKGRAMGVLLSL